MTIISAQEYQSVFSELQCLKDFFLALEQENQRLLGDLHQITIENQQTQQKHEELAVSVQQLEATIVSLQQQGRSIQEIAREPNVELPMKLDGMQL